MDNTEYQKRYVETNSMGTDLFYPALGLAGETGEVVEKIKKYYRDGNLDAAAVALELGDVLWYLTRLGDLVGYTLADIMQMNVDKLQSRFERGVVGGSGDTR